MTFSRSHRASAPWLCRHRGASPWWPVLTGHCGAWIQAPASSAGRWRLGRRRPGPSRWPRTWVPSWRLSRTAASAVTTSRPGRRTSWALVPTSAWSRLLPMAGPWSPSAPTASCCAGSRRSAPCLIRGRSAPPSPRSASTARATGYWPAWRTGGSGCTTSPAGPRSSSARLPLPSAQPLLPPRPSQRCPRNQAVASWTTMYASPSTDRRRWLRGCGPHFSCSRTRRTW
jgi:hypothetical protein